MHSNSPSKQSCRAPFELLLLLCVLYTGGCSRNDGHSAMIEYTLSVLRANAESWESSDYSEHSHTYLAPAFRRAIPLLETNGVDSLPMMLTATFSRGLDVENHVTGCVYMFSWLDAGGQVRGFYLRSEGEPDTDINPALSREAQVEGTAWMLDGGPVLGAAEEISKVPEQEKGSSIVVDPRILAREKLLVGLRLADGQKTAPVEAYFQQMGDE